MECLESDLNRSDVTHDLQLATGKPELPATQRLIEPIIGYDQAIGHAIRLHVVIHRAFGWPVGTRDGADGCADTVRANTGKVGRSRSTN